MPAKRHRHTFTALWWHFGPHGRQNVHVHDCVDEDCSRVLVGEGRDCRPIRHADAALLRTDHHRETL